MFKKVIYLILGISLYSCSAPSLYQPSLLYNKEGYTETMITATSYQIKFKGNDSSNFERVNDFALLRAAEITRQHGFHYFLVVTHKNHSIQENRRVNMRKSTTVVHTFYKNKNIDMCRIVKNGTIEYVKMSQMKDTRMMQKHKSTTGNTYIETEWGNYVNEFVIKKPVSTLFIIFINDTKIVDRNIRKVNNTIERIISKYQLKLTT